MNTVNGPSTPIAKYHGDYILKNMSFQIATIAPEDTSYRTTLRTLQFAEVAKVGVVTVKRNEIFFNDLQKDLKTDIEASKKKLESLQKGCWSLAPAIRDR